jgi:hypothetical protein
MDDGQQRTLAFTQPHRRCRYIAAAMLLEPRVCRGRLLVGLLGRAP